MGPTHHLVTNVRFRKTKSTVSVKSDFWAHRFYLSSIADTRNIIVVKLIKSVIANPTVGEIKIILSDTVDRHEKDT